MVKFRYDKNQFLEYIARIGNNLPQMVVCSIDEATFDYETAKKFHNSTKKNKHIYQLGISGSIFKKRSLFKKDSPLNLVLDGILSMGFDYIYLPDCQLKNCLDADTIKYLSHNQVKSISMSGSELSSSDVEIIAKGIQFNKNITSVSLNNCSIRDAGLIFLSNAISKHKSIENLVISSSVRIEYLFRDDVDILHNKFDQSSIDYFFDSMKNQETITYLDFSGIKVANIDKLAEFVKFNNIIANINLSSCGIRESDNFFDALKYKESLRILNFAGNKISNIDKLLEIMQTNTNITELNLCGCGISTIDINRILEVLVSNKNLISLEIDGNGKFDDVCGYTLIEILKKNHTLKYLGLATHNDILSERCMEDIFLEMEKREDLDINLHSH